MPRRAGKHHNRHGSRDRRALAPDSGVDPTTVARVRDESGVFRALAANPPPLPSPTTPRGSTTPLARRPQPYRATSRVAVAFQVATTARAGREPEPGDRLGGDLGDERLEASRPTRTRLPISVTEVDLGASRRLRAEPCAARPGRLDRDLPRVDARRRPRPSRARCSRPRRRRRGRPRSSRVAARVAYRRAPTAPVKSATNADAGLALSSAAVPALHDPAAVDRRRPRRRAAPPGRSRG